MSTNSPDQAATTTSVANAAETLWTRLNRALGPVLPGLILDFVDTFSWLGVGPGINFVIGIAVGAWLSSYYPYRLGWRVLIALGSGLYAMAPGTEAVPLATILTCLGRFIETPSGKNRVAASRTALHSESHGSDKVNGNPMSPEGTESETSPASDPIRQKRAKCPECGSNSLRYGQVDQSFRPAGISAWAKGHEVNAFVCLECGFVGHYLSNADLQDLESHGHQ